MGGWVLPWRDMAVEARTHSRGIVHRRGHGESCTQDTRREDGDQEVTRIPQEPKTHSRPPFRDVKCKGSLEGSTSSSKTCRFHCCTCEIIIYSVDPLVNP